MERINDKLIVSLVFSLIILSSCALAHESEALFEVGNEQSVIEDVKIVSDNLEIIISDPNGYEEIVYDGYVAVFVDRKEIGRASFKEGVSEKAKFILPLNNVQYEEITIKVSDGANVVEKSQNLQESDMSSITGLAVSEPEQKTGISIFERIINFIKGLFKNE
ncbi:hypothetical protein KY339_00900 [Candidatus Woesearchaeota archaeon]|nr:hypothetical protein [Candidatus Woesearchaeota archaeon]